MTGALLLVPSRKGSQTAPTWIPVRAGLLTALLARFCSWRRTKVASNDFLFPSRKLRATGSRRKWRPNPRNRLGQSSFVKLMRSALVEVCALTKRQARRFTIHSLRVGGINYYKRCGVSIGMRAKIAAHKDLRTARRYLRQLPVEQIAELSSMVVHT